MPEVLEDPPLQEEETWECSTCGSTFDHPEDARICCLHSCQQCGTEYRDDNDAYMCCRYECGSCGADYQWEDEAIECCQHYCSTCGAGFDSEYDADDCCNSSGGDALPLGDVVAHQITVPVIEGRPARLCSLEQEVISGGRHIAALLYEEQVADDNHVYQYHWSGSRPGLIHCEADGSLPSDGGEIIYDRFNLSDPRDSEKLSRIVTKVRQLRDEHGVVRTGFAAGIHVHISAKDVNGKCLSTRDMTALYELWCHAEDMLYSLSASGWNRHRQPSDSPGGYCKAVPKFDGNVTPAKVWRAMRADRYYGLNFQRLFNAASNCSCGAGGMGDWDGCDCGAMERATVEWRVFNASTLPRTIHAWLLMAHAITAYSASHEVGTLGRNEYGSQTKAEKREVLDWLLERLPLTEGEKAVILDAADRSPGL